MWKNFPIYQELLESLLYLAVNNTPEIAFAVNACALFINRPLFGLSYPKNSSVYVGIVYRSHDFNIHGFCDFEYIIGKRYC